MDTKGGTIKELEKTFTSGLHGREETVHEEKDPVLVVGLQTSRQWLC